MLYRCIAWEVEKCFPKPISFCLFIFFLFILQGLFTSSGPFNTGSPDMVAISCSQFSVGCLIYININKQQLARRSRHSNWIVTNTLTVSHHGWYRDQVAGCVSKVSTSGAAGGADGPGAGASGCGVAGAAWAGGASGTKRSSNVKGDPMWTI